MKIHCISFFVLFSWKLFSQEIDTINIKLPSKVYFESPCQTINECIDTIYQNVDTLFLILQDNREPIFKEVEIRGEDSIEIIDGWVFYCYPINKYTIKKNNIRLFLPSYYNNSCYA